MSRVAKSNSTYFIALRKRLDLLGYSDLPIGLDSAPLVQQMVEDIIATTETLKETEEGLEKEKARASLLEAQIEPLQDENVRITRENTQLHQLLIKSKEDIVKQDNEHSISSFELNSENRRLKLIYQKSNDHVKDLEKKLEQANAKLKEALELPASLNLSDVNDGSSRRTKRSMRSRRNGGSTFDQMSVVSSVDDTELIALKEENLKLKNDLEEANNKMQLHIAKLAESEDIIKIKDEEIIRIGAELQRETGKNGFIITLRHKCAQQEIEIEKLRAQLRVSGTGRVSSRIRRFVRTTPKTTVSINNGTNESVLSSDIMSLRSHNTASISSETIQEEEEEFVEEKHDIVVVNKAHEEEEIKEIIKSQFSSSINETKQIDALKAKLQKKKKSISILKNEITKRDVLLVKKDKCISQMASDIAFIGDNLKTILKEKEKIVNEIQSKKETTNKEEIVEQKLQEQRKEKENDDFGISLLTKQLETTREDYEKRLSNKKAKIQLLKQRIAGLLQPKDLPSCKECAKLRKQIEELENELAEAKKANSDIDELRSNYKQLEKLLRAADEERDLHTDDAEKVIKLQSALSAVEMENDEIKMALCNKEQELEKLKKLLEESEERSNSVPDIKQRARIAVDKAKSESNALQAELQSTKQSFKEITSKLIECQKLNRKFQQQAQDAMQEAANKKEEAKFHRSKNEEIQEIAATKIKKLQDEMFVKVSQLKQQVRDKTHEAELLQKLLLKTRSEIAPLSEVQIPQMKEEIAKMTREKQELANRVNSLIELSQFTEKTTEFSPNSLSFIQALHKFQDQLSPFVTN